jgi:hypothetical protein
MMASDDKKAADAKSSAPATDKGTSDAKPSKAGGGDPAASHSRGEGQKPVTQAYKKNWNLIFGKKKKR